MRLLLRIVKIAVAVVALAFVLFVAFGRENTWEVLAGPPDMGRYDFAAASRHETSNDALACSPGLCDGKADFELPVHAATPGEVMRAVDDAVLSSGALARRVDDRSDPAYARYVTHSPWMRFPDTTDIEAVELELGRTGLRAYARAQIGRRDFGANATRLMDWLQ